MSKVITRENEEDADDRQERTRDEGKGGSERDEPPALVDERAPVDIRSLDAQAEVAETGRGRDHLPDLGTPDDERGGQDVRQDVPRDDRRRARSGKTRGDDVVTLSKGERL